MLLYHQIAYISYLTVFHFKLALSERPFENAMPSLLGSSDDPLSKVHMLNKTLKYN